MDKQNTAPPPPSAAYQQWRLKAVVMVLALAFQRTRKSHHCHSSLPELSLSPFLCISLSLFHHINSLIIRVQHNVPCVVCVRRTCASIYIMNIVVVDDDSDHMVWRCRFCLLSLRIYFPSGLFGLLRWWWIKLYL